MESFENMPIRFYRSAYNFANDFIQYLGEVRDDPDEIIAYLKESNTRRCYHRYYFALGYLVASGMLDIADSPDVRKNNIMS